MKKLIVLLATLVMVVVLVGCNNSDVTIDDSIDMQITTDMVEKAKEYADPLFHEYLNNQNITDYEITQTNYGFITGDPVIFIIGYQYTVDDFEFLYGYKLELNENQTFSVLGEGEFVGEFTIR